jgi:hypothetical protein
MRLPLALLAAAVWAQDSPSGPPPKEERPRLDAPEMPAEGTIRIKRQRREGQRPSDEPRAAPPPETDSDAPTAVTLEQAQAAFEPALTAFLKQNSSGGAFSLRRTAGAEPTRLKLLTVDRDSVRRSAAGRFSGRAAFEDPAKRIVLVEFAFAPSPRWHVVSAREAGR